MSMKRFGRKFWINVLELSGEKLRRMKRKLKRRRKLSLLVTMKELCPGMKSLMIGSVRMERWRRRVNLMRNQKQRRSMGREGWLPMVTMEDENWHVLKWSMKRREKMNLYENNFSLDKQHNVSEPLITIMIPPKLRNAMSGSVNHTHFILLS